MMIMMMHAAAEMIANNISYIISYTNHHYPFNITHSTMPSASFLQIREQVVKPTSARDGIVPIVSVPLAGCDLIYSWFNVKFAYFFEETLNTLALKASLAKVGWYVEEELIDMI